MKKIKVSTRENPYDIIIEKGCFKNFLDISKRYKFSNKIFAVIDSKVFKLHRASVDNIISSANLRSESIKIVSSEENKSFQSLQKILEKMISTETNRDNLLLSIGGGVIGDLGGFAAAVYSRGIKCVQIPTTLLSCVDSSVGGKTGINLAGVKNIVGSYHQPSVVLIDTEFLETLPKSEILSGIGEITKYAFLTDEAFFSFVQKHLDDLLNLDQKVISRTIEKSVRFKADVVAEDEKETLGIRKILNLGHTFGHAIEVDQNYKIKHGQAVVIGILCSLILSKKLGIMDDVFFEKSIDMLSWFKNKIAVKNYNAGAMIKIMRKDKKNFDGKIKFVLLKNIGQTIVNVDADEKLVIESIDEGMRFFK